MRLFKRQLSDTSPQLVSAIPLSQDGTVPVATVDENSDPGMKNSQHENDGLNQTPAKDNVSDTEKPSSSQNCASNRKGNITTMLINSMHIQIRNNRHLIK